MQLRDMRTLRELRAAAPPVDAVRRLSDRALRAAAHNPDHSQAARDAAEVELQARNAKPDRWRIAVPSFLNRRDLARYGDKLFFGVRAHPFRRPARVAVLRTLGEPSYSAPLSRAVAREFAPYGHVVSLAAADNLAAIAVLENARDYRAFARRLGQRAALSLRLVFALGRGLAVRASPAWRPMAARLLMDSSDAVIVDLTHGDADLDLALAECDRARCVFVVLWGRLDEAEAMLRARNISAPCFHYAPDGEIQHRAAFRAAMLAAMRATHGLTP